MYDHHHKTTTTTNNNNNTKLNMLKEDRITCSKVVRTYLWQAE